MNFSTHFLFLIIVSFGCFFSFTTAIPPSISSLSYLIKQYQFFSTRSEVAIITARFDQTPFIDRSCTSGNATSVSLIPCCSPSITTNCFSPSASDHICLDATPQYWNLTSVKTITFEFRVENTSTCDAVAFITKSLAGDPDIAVSFHNTTSTPNFGNADYISTQIGTDQMVLCCSDILALNPNWNGVVFVSVIPFTTTQFVVEVLPNASRLNAVDFYHLVPISVTCDTFNFTTNDCNNGQCLFLPPTLDPLFSYLAILTGLQVPLEYQSQQLSIAIRTRFVRDASPTISQTTFPFPVRYLNDPTCRYNFPDIINSNGERLSNVASLQKEILPCRSQDFFLASNEFSKSVRAVQVSLSPNVDAVYDLYFQALSWVVSDVFVGCVDMVENNLLVSSPQQKTFENVQACFTTNETSSSFLSDPCCNPATQQTTCCVPRTTNVISSHFSVNEFAVNNTCNLPQCTMNVLKDYIVLAESSQSRQLSCSAAITAALQDPLLDYNKNPLDYCFYHTYFTQCNTNSDCAFLGPGSICLGLGYCTIPCTTDSDCVTQQCLVLQSTPTCFLYNPFDVRTNNTEAGLFFISCIKQRLNSFVALFIRQELGLNAEANESEYISAFFDNMFTERCVGPFTLGVRDNRTACESVMQCNWAFCNSRDSPNECTAANCLDPVISSPSFCGVCVGDVCQELSSYPACRYNGPFTQTICEQLFNGRYNPLPTYDLPNCFRQTNGSIDLCFPPERCGDLALSTYTCDSYCFVVDIANETVCNTTGSINSLPLVWLNWIRNGMTFGVCVLSNITDLDTCYRMGNNRTEWWPGTTWSDAFILSPQECTGVCVGGYRPPEISNEMTCLSQYYCDECDTCLDETSCISQGQCDDETGCYLPFQSDGVMCANDGYQLWTPIGCFRSDLTQNTCTLLGGTWIPKSTDALTCTTKANVCVDPSTTQLPYVMYRPRPGYSSKNATECAKCGGYIDSFYHWTSNKWTRRMYYPLEWRVRNYTQANTWGAVLNFSKLVDFWERAVARKFSNIVSSELLCRYGQMMTSLNDLACTCGEDRDQIERVCYSNITKSVTSLAEPCQGINALFNFSSGYLVSEPEFMAEGTDCIAIQIAVVPQSQFQQNQIITLSSVSISLPQATQINQVRFIKNSNGVVVGEMIGDGVSFQLSNNVTRGLTACLYFPKSINSTLKITTLDFALPDTNFTSFRPTKLNLSLSTTEACIDLKQSLTLFPIGLINNWSTARFIDTFDPGQLAIIFIGLILYFVMFGFTVYHLVLHFVDIQRRVKRLTIAQIALFSLGVFLLVRIIYLIMLPNGVIAVAPAIDVLFSELPAILFFFICSLIVIRWAEIYHFTMTAGKSSGITKLIPAVITVNAFLVLSYIILVIVFFSVSSHMTVNCATPLSELQQQSPSEIVAIIYKVFFALVCLAMSVAFCLYGFRIVRYLQKNSSLVATQKDVRRKQSIIKLIVVSSVCTGCLLAQAINLLHSSFDRSGVRTLVGVLILLYIVELAPAFIFVWLFKKTSLFVRIHKRIFGSSVSTNTRGSVPISMENKVELDETPGRRPAASSLSTDEGPPIETTDKPTPLNIEEDQNVDNNIHHDDELNQDKQIPHIPIGQG